MSGAQGLTDSKSQHLQICTAPRPHPPHTHTHAPIQHMSMGPHGWSQTYSRPVGAVTDQIISIHFYHLFPSISTTGPIGTSPLMAVPHIWLPETCQKQQVLTPNCLYYLDPAHWCYSIMSGAIIWPQSDSTYIYVRIYCKLHKRNKRSIGCCPLERLTRIGQYWNNLKYLWT